MSILFSGGCLVLSASSKQLETGEVPTFPLELVYGRIYPLLVVTTVINMAVTGLVLWLILKNTSLVVTICLSVTLVTLWMLRRIMKPAKLRIDPTGVQVIPRTFLGGYGDVQTVRPISEFSHVECRTQRPFPETTGRRTFYAVVLVSRPVEQTAEKRQGVYSSGDVEFLPGLFESDKVWFATILGKGLNLPVKHVTYVNGQKTEESTPTMH